MIIFCSSQNQSIPFAHMWSALVRASRQTPAIQWRRPCPTVSPLTTVAFWLTMSDNNLARGHVGGRPGLLQHWLFVFANPQRDSAGGSGCAPAGGAINNMVWESCFPLVALTTLSVMEMKHGWLATQAGENSSSRSTKEGGTQSQISKTKHASFVLQSDIRQTSKQHSY